MVSLRTLRTALAVFSLFISSCKGFYIPGVRPQAFGDQSKVPLKVNALTSTHTQIPRDYYRLPFCKPDEGIHMASENLGEFLTGNKIENSPYVINMKKEMFCEKVCQKTLSDRDSAKLKYHIFNGYHQNWIIDNLPSAYLGSTEEKKKYAGGFPLGFIDNQKKAYIYNHVNIHIDYHDASAEDGFLVVGFAVEPLSVKHTWKDNYVWDGITYEGRIQPLNTCPSTSNTHLTHDEIQSNQPVSVGETILYTYDVIWNESEVEWTSRWDIYLNDDHLIPAQVHWYSITNSILVVLFLSLLVISILVRNLRRDIAAYNALASLADEEKDEEIDEKGWKLVHADVFRPPQTHPMLFCVFVGSGVQLCVTALCAICFSAVGFLSPARRGSLLNAVLVFYMLFGSLAGYTSSRLYKAFKGRQWQICTVTTALFFPGIAFGVFLLFNVILAFMGSSGSAPFLDVIIVAAMWCGVSIPLVFLGAYFGYKEETIEFPTVTSTIARAIPPAPVFLNPTIGMAMTGIIPFSAAYVELFFIMTSLWMDQFYYVFGFTLIVYLILIITCAEMTVLLVYYQLCAENHRWWWYSFFCSGSTAFYTFGYSIFWFRTLEASRKLMTYMLYFGYMGIICFAMMLIFGMVGALNSLWFIRKIFSTIKVD